MSKKIGIILGILYILFIAVYWLQIGGANTIVLRNTIYLIPPCIAVIAGIFSLKTYGLKGSRAVTLGFLTSGMACWFIGEVLFYTYEIILHINPFPSVADIFYLIAYPLLFIALFNEIKSTTVHLKKMHPAVIFLFIVAGLALAALVIYFGVFLAYDSKETLFTNFIAIGYGVGDLLLIVANMFVLILAWEFRDGSLSRVWVSLFISFVLTLIADILFAIYTPQYKAEVWFYKSLLDSIWMASYLLFAYGLFNFGFSIFDAKAKLRAIKFSKKRE